LNNFKNKNGGMNNMLNIHEIAKISVDKAMKD